MNTAKLLLIASIAAASFAAAAADVPEANQGPDQVAQGTLSRQQVQSEFTAAKQAGVAPWASTYNPNATFRSDLTRSQVTAEYLASRDEVAAMTAEDSGSAYLAHVAARQHRVGTDLAGQPVNTAR